MALLWSRDSCDRWPRLFTNIVSKSLYTQMAQIRGTIELLTRILFDNGTQKVKAEIFRSAKFNGLDGVSNCQYRRLHICSKKLNK